MTKIKVVRKLKQQQLIQVGHNMIRKLITAIIFLFLAACSENYCITDNPATTSAPGSPIIIANSSSASIYPSTTPLWNNGPTLGQGGNVLIRVSGRIDTCYSCSRSSCPTGATCCTDPANTTPPGCIKPICQSSCPQPTCPTLEAGQKCCSANNTPNGCIPPTVCPSDAPNCADPMCDYGTAYAVPANSYYWVYTTMVPRNSTVQLAVPPPSDIGVSQGSDCVAIAGSTLTDNYSQCSCSSFGATTPSTCTGPSDCGSMSCLSSASCELTTSCNDLTIGNKWIENIAPYNMPYSPNNLGPEGWKAAGHGLEIQLGYHGPSGAPVNTPNMNDDNTVGEVFFNSPAKTPLQFNAGFLGGVYPNQLPYSPQGTSTQTVINTSDQDLPLYLRIVTRLIPGGANINKKDTQYYSFIGGYNVYIKPNECLAINGQPYMAGSESFGGDLHISITPASTPSTPNPTPITHSLADFAPLVTNCSDLPSSEPNFQAMCSQSEIDSGTAAYYFANSANVSTSSTYGQLAYRINPLSKPNSSGVLEITSYTVAEAGAFSKLINEVVDDVRSTLASSTQTIFTNLTNNVDYISYTRILLQLYIIIYAISFLMGMVQISQLDLIVRVIKIAVVVGLTSQTSWTFFSNNFFNIYLDGASDLIGIFTGNTTNKWAFVDKIANVLFLSGSTWIRLLAVILTPLGFVMVLLTLWSMVCYAMAIFECVITYMMSILAINILIVLAPIFIPFMLFSITKHLFESWLKFIFGFTLKPVILIIGITILSELLYMIVLQLFSAPVCYGCVWQVSLGPLNTIINIISNFVNLDTFFFCIPFVKGWGWAPNGDGSSFASSTGLDIVNVVLFVLVTKSMHSLPSFVDEFTKRLTGLRDASLKAGIGEERHKTISDRVSGAFKQQALGIVGMDDQSKARRAEKARELASKTKRTEAREAEKAQSKGP